MQILKKIFPYLFLILLALIFFYKYFLFGLVPFPGDLLVAEYQPFRSYSYEGYTPGSVPNKAQYFDSIREFYPWITLTVQELKEGRLPLWNPYNFSGSPHLGNFLTAVFYPFNLLYLVMNQADAWAILVVLQVLLASLFMYLYGRKIGLKSPAAIFSAVAFAYSSYMNVWLQFQVIGHSILWIPLILYCTESLLEKFTPKIYILLIISLCSSIFAGHPLDSTIVLLGTLSYLLFRLFTLRIKMNKGIYFLSAFFVSIIVGLVQIIPTAQLLAHSTRAAIEYDFLLNNLLVQPLQLIMILVPDYFGNPATRSYWPDNSYVGNTLSVGVTSLFFILLSLPVLRKTNKYKQFVVFFASTSLIILVFATKNPLSALLYSIELPVISSIQPTKLLAFFAFCLSMLAGIGMNELISIKTVSRKSFFVVALIMLFAFTLAFLGTIFVPAIYRTIALKQTVLSLVIISAVFIAILLFTFVKRLKTIAIFGLIILLVVEQYYSFQKFNPFSPKSFIFPDAPVLTFLQENAGINRFWGYGTAKIDSNIATQYKLFSPDGFGALNLSLYNEFIRTSKDGKIPNSFNQETRSVAEIEPGYGENDLPSNQFRLRVLDALGVKYILNRTENPVNNSTFPTDRFKLVWQDDSGWQVFENLESAPRFFLTHRVETYNTREQFEQRFFSPDFDPQKMVLVENFPQTSLCKEDEIVTSFVSLARYAPSEIKFKVHSQCPMFLYISDAYDDHWTATIDSLPSTIYRTNYTFRGIVVPTGDHEVQFQYTLF